MSHTDRLPALPDEPTRSYDQVGTVRPAALAPTHTSAGAEPSQELVGLLRRRLTLLAHICLCVSVAFMAILTPFLIGEHNWEVLGVLSVLVILPVLGTVILHSRRAFTLRELRFMELVALAALVGVLVWSIWEEMYRGRQGSLYSQLAEGTVRVLRRPLPIDRPDTPVLQVDWIQWPRFVWALAGWKAAHWILLIVGYGIFIPNTWRRATLIISIIAIIPLLLNGTICLIDPDITWKSAGIFMLATTVMIAFVAVMVIFGSHRIESLRREALAARRLGQYQFKDLIGAGGMGEVYRAEHMLLRRPCAIKLIRPERAGDPTNLRRFEREVQATATLTNWHTVEIYDYGHAQDGTFYYVMEYLPGLTLEQLVNRHGPLPPERAVYLLRQMCAALQEAHAIGLIHRDIKPGNIIVGQRGGLPDVAKLLDFGLVRTMAGAAVGESLTQHGMLVGTPAYMSPEQAGGDGEVDARSDIYSLGAVAYFLLTGKPPFTGKTAVQVLAAHLHERVKPPREERADLPDDVSAVVVRCLAKGPEQRFQSVAELENALSACRCADGWNREQAAAWWGAYAIRPA
jgi:hypothetical protein